MRSEKDGIGLLAKLELLTGNKSAPNFVRAPSVPGRIILSGAAERYF